LAPDKARSTPAWLLPGPVRRFREHLREIRRLAGESHRELIDARQATIDLLAGLNQQLQQLQMLVGTQAEDLQQLQMLVRTQAEDLQQLQMLVRTQAEELQQLQQLPTLVGTQAEELSRIAARLEETDTVGRLDPTQGDFEPEFLRLQAACTSYTMTSTERMYALWRAVQHITTNEVPGDVVECGVWRGGSMMLAAMALKARNDLSRSLWLFDTFAGMTEPGEHDVEVTTRLQASAHEDIVHRRKDSDAFAFASLDEVRMNMRLSEYPDQLVHYVAGKVEDTLPGEAPASIALLRLDTDWYESTRHELEHLWNRVERNGVLIVDDYGHWAGARKAVEEFFAKRSDAPVLWRIDYTGRVGVKR
jgi:O-methyltransferase